MDYLAAAKRGSRFLSETSAKIPTDEQLLQENQQYEKAHPELLKEFQEFAARNQMEIERRWDTQGLYADNGRMIFCFRDWTTLREMTVVYK